MVHRIHRVTSVKVIRPHELRVGFDDGTSQEIDLAPMLEGELYGPLRDPALFAVVKREGDWWIGWIEEIPGVNCQEGSRDELLETLRVTLREALEFNRAEALDRDLGVLPV